MEIFQPYAELSASIETQRAAGLVSACKLLDLNRVEVKKLTFDNEIPLAVLSFATQEILLFKDIKTGEIKLGDENHIDKAFYAVVLTKTALIDSKAEIDPLTNGWKVVVWSRGAGF